MQLPTPKQVSPRPSARRQTASPQPCGRSKPSSNTVRGSSISLPIPSSRALTPAPTVLSDVFEIVADGNADVLAEMIAFSGAEHMAELRSKKQEDFGQNLLHCAVASGQLTTLQVLLQHKNFDPNQVDSVYTRSTPMMEAVKIGGRLDLIECLLAAGGRLDVQDVNGDSVLHWAAREISAAFLRNVLHLARKHGRMVPELLAALQLKNNSGENAADVGANDVARESIRRLVSGEEAPGLPTKKNTSGSSRHNSQSGGGMGGGHKSGERRSNASAGAQRPGQPGSPTGFRPSQLGNPTGLRPSQSGSPMGGSRPSLAEGLSPECAGANASAHQRQSQVSKKRQGQHRTGLVAPLTAPPLATTGGTPMSGGVPDGAVSGALVAEGASTGPSAVEAIASFPPEQAGMVVGGVATRVGGQPTVVAAGKPFLRPERILPKVKVTGGHEANFGGTEAPASMDNVRARASSTPVSPSSSRGQSRGASR